MRRSSGCIGLAIAALVAARAWSADSPGHRLLPVPAAAVETTLPTDGDHVAQLAFDGRPETFFRSARAPKSGDTFTLVLAAPAKVTRVEVLTGKPDRAEALASEGYVPPPRINLKFRKGNKGIAGTSGTNIVAYDGWFKAHPDDCGALVHEAIHVIQSYPRYDPPWLAEGIDDYVRFWIYEPSPPRPLNPARIHYTNSYQMTGAFLACLVANCDKDIVRKLNAALRKGEYKSELFKEYTGKDLDTLWDEFKESLAPIGSHGTDH